MEYAVYACLVLLIGITVMSAILLLRPNKADALPEELTKRLAVLEQVAAGLPATFRDEARISREDMRSAISGQAEGIDQRLSGVETRLGDFGKAQAEQLAAMRTEASDGRDKLEKAVQRNAEGFATSQAERLKETNDAVQTLADRLMTAQRDGRDEQRLALEGVTAKVGQLIESNETKQEALRGTVAEGLEKLRTDNSEKLEKMRATVDEKLQGTLEKRLGESFQLVSERLEQVHKGLGEMQTLATGVGDLKRVLGSGLIDQSQKMTVAARAMAEKKALGHLS